MALTLSNFTLHPTTVPADSIGNSELNTANIPADAQVLSFDGATSALEWVTPSGGSTSIPDITTNAATNVSGTSFDAPVTVNAFGLTDKDALDLFVDYRETGATTWQRTTATMTTTLGDTTISIGGLTTSTEYEFRAAAQDQLNPSIEVLGSTLTVTTLSVSVEQPTNVSPADLATGVTLTPTLTSDAFNVINGTDTHAASQWRVIDGTTTVYDSGEVADLTSHAIPALSALASGVSYTWQVRHKGTSLGYSSWSVATTFTTGEIAQPSNVSPADLETDVGETPTLESSVFSATGTDTHTNSQWKVIRKSDQVTVYDSGSVNDLETHTVPAGNLVESETYQWQVRHEGAEFGWSDYSTVTEFTTASAFSDPPDLSIASYDSVSFGVGAQDSIPLSLVFSSDGTKMYMVGFITTTIHQYTLSTAWDLLTASYDSVSFGIGAQDDRPFGLTSSSDGTKMYMLGDDTATIYQYTLSTAWDLLTASYDSVSFGVVAQDTRPRGLAFSADGTKMYMLGDGTNTIHQYTLPTAWDLSTASYDSVSFGVGAQETIPYDIAFSSDDTKMYIVGNDTFTVYQYSV